jgi:hypothetical protein
MNLKAVYEGRAFAFFLKIRRDGSAKACGGKGLEGGYQ